MPTTREYAAYYREHLLTGLMPFWDARCIDKQYGGYQISFDREGRPTDTDKYVWFQARQTYMYGLLYNVIEKRTTWLSNAKWGYDYLKDRAYAGSGRFNYHMAPDGAVKIGTTSVFADCFANQAISEYMRATGFADKSGMSFLNECYDALESNIMNPYFKDIYENTWSDKYLWHDLYLTAMSAADTVSDSLGEKRTAKLIDFCLDKIMNWFVKDDYKLVFEAVSWDKAVCFDQPCGSFINPGHSLESMWFCMNIARKRGAQATIQKCANVIRWIAEIGIDKQYGGVFSYLDARGDTPVAIDWYKETNSLWDDKVFWANAESLCCFAMAYTFTGDDFFLEQFERLHVFCRDHFFDPEFGEWYERLNRDGSVKVSDKGTMWKCAYHVARAVIFITLLFDGTGTP
jgi:N-acylglucosamine 2-epimerase